VSQRTEIKEETDPRYQPLVPLGSGGMGTAWLCRSVGAASFERLVVVKRLHPHVAERQEATLRFMDEAKLTASLHHANVVGTHEVGVDGRGPFIVLEYIEGATLEQLLDGCERRKIKLPVPITLRLMLDALAGLEAVHTARDHAGRPLNILHRDISLQNLLVGVDGVCRVADFGAAKSDLRKFSTDQNYLLGRLLYMPPEYLRRDEVGVTLDIYSLGITMWHMLTGGELWETASEGQVIARIM
jgi:serine/threonine-protein kinase